MCKSKFDNFLNIYETKIKNLKIKNENENKNENIIIKSKIPFTLYGIGIPKIPSKIKDNIKILFEYEDSYSNFNRNIFNEEKNNYEIEMKIEENEDNKNLSLGKLEKSINIKEDKEYKINISGINGCSYIDQEEDFNPKNKIFIKSNRLGSILTCLIIE